MFTWHANSQLKRAIVLLKLAGAAKGLRETPMIWKPTPNRATATEPTEVAGKDRLDFRIWAVPAAARPALRLALLGDW